MGNALRRYLRLVVGDDTGAETEVTVPWRLEYLRLKVGEPAELLVLSTRMVGWGEWIFCASGDVRAP